MGNRFAKIAFTNSVREMQRQHGSRGNYVAMDQGDDYNHLLGSAEAEFIGSRDSFYIASVSESGWPYVQHRGGPVGFVRVLSERSIAFADYRGNRQYVTLGNVQRDSRVALFFMDYVNRLRLKLLGRVRVIGHDELDLLAELETPGYRALVERGLLIEVEAFDWNCPQHITPRYSEVESTEISRQRVRSTASDHSDALGSLTTRSRVFGHGPLDVVISGVRELGPRVRAYELRAAESGELPAIEAGAHLPVPVQRADGNTVTRNYSICSSPARRDIYEIAVLRQHAGDSASNAIHEQFELGLRLRCGLPQNYFKLHRDERPAVLIAGGIGITPIKAMAHALSRRGGELKLYYAVRSLDEAPFATELRLELGASLTVLSSAAGERMDIERIVRTAPGNAVFYACGPARLLAAFMRAAESQNIESDRVRLERFVANTGDREKPIFIYLRRSDRNLEVSSDQSILEALQDAGIDAPYSCRIGRCRSCVARVLDGEVDHRDSALSATDRDRDRLMCICVSRAHTENLTLDL